MFAEKDVSGAQTSGISDLKRREKWASTGSRADAMVKT